MVSSGGSVVAIGRGAVLERWPAFVARLRCGPFTAPRLTPIVFAICIYVQMQCMLVTATIAAMFVPLQPYQHRFVPAGLEATQKRVA